MTEVQKLLAAVAFILGHAAIAGTADACKPTLESRADQGWFRVRPHENAFIHCTLSRETLSALVRELLQNPEAATTEYKLLNLGRLVDHPWLSRHLAEQALNDADWDAATGQPRNGDLNNYVRIKLSAPAALAMVQSIFDGTDYTVTGASVEKVLVMPANEVPNLALPSMKLVPFDAITHITLERH